MTKPGPIDFWFSIGSLYSYLSVMRLDRIALRRLHVRFSVSLLKKLVRSLHRDLAY